ncbi:MAG: TRAP transporter small permease [Xanthomonadales bacterium]|jgi:TRAP-type C4-dicarboxylate transport system permease small subunit|nr:TRAP transporter small permease [Xanthomonadales bacterium]
MKKTVKILDAILTRVLVLLMFCLVGAVLWQVISRYVFSSPSSWTEELARFLLIWISLLGAAYAFRSGMHLALDIIPRKLTARPALWLKNFTIVMIVVFSVSVLVIGGGSLVQLTWELKQYSAVLGLPMAYVYSVIPVSGLLISVYAIAAVSDDSIGKPQDAIPAGE